MQRHELSGARTPERTANSSRRRKPSEGATILDHLTAITNVNVIPMDEERVLENQTVVVRRDRVLAVLPTEEMVALPGHCLTIDGDGSYLTPGLADMHVHLDMRDDDPRQLLLYLAEGTTTVRSMNGTIMNARWRDQVSEGDLAGPTILTAGNTLIGGVTEEMLDGFPYAVPAFLPSGVDDVVLEVRDQAEGWPDLIKVYDGLTEEVYLAAIRAGKQAGAYVAGHALDDSSLQSILTSGIDEIAHIDELSVHHWIGTPGSDHFRFDYDAIPQTAELMRHHEVAVVSNLVADETMHELIYDEEAVIGRPEYERVRPAMKERWRSIGRHKGDFKNQGQFRRDLEMPFLKALLLGLHKHGVLITVGTDTSTLEGSVPSQIHGDIELLVDSGLSSFEALVAATRTAGLVVDRMNRDGRFGIVAPGQRADLLLLRQNPLDDVSCTRDRVGVMARGTWYPQTELDRLVSEFISTY